MNEKNVAVIIPCYQQVHHLKRCLASVIPQLGEGDELFLCIDSADETLGDPEDRQKVNRLLETARELSPAKVKLVESPYRMGVSLMRDLGAREAKAPWLKFLDADDFLAPLALNFFRAVKLQEATRVFYGQQVMVRDNVPMEVRLSDMTVIERRNPLLVCPTFIRRDAFEEVGRFDGEIEFEEDWDLWLRVWQTWGLGVVQSFPVPIGYYCIHKEEREQKEKERCRTTRGMDVRQWFAMKYKIQPLR
ncbi:MAG TPA: glycosyltransferase [Verrucomicrobiae bacterium]